MDGQNTQFTAFLRSYLGMRVFQALYAFVGLCLLWGIFYERVVLPSYITAVLLVSIAYFLYVQTARIKAYKELFGLADPNKNLPQKQDIPLKKPIDMDEKVKNLIESAKFNRVLGKDRGPLYGNNESPQNDRPEPWQLTQPFQLPRGYYPINHMNLNQKDSFGEQGGEGAYGVANTQRKLLIDEIPNNWWVGTTLQNQKKEFPKNNPRCRLRKNELDETNASRDEQQFRKHSFAGRDPQSLRSTSSFLQQRAKFSLNSKLGQFYEETDSKENQFSDEQVNKLILDFKIRRSEFENWYQHNLSIWLSKSVIPELLSYNFANIHKINMDLNVLGLELEEMELGHLISEKNNRAAEFEPKIAKNTSFIKIKINQFIRFGEKNFIDFMPAKISDELTRKNCEENFERLLMCAEERLWLDFYLSQEGKLTDQERIDKLLRLNQLKGEDFVNIYSSASETFSDEELLLVVALQSIVENDPYYKKNRVRISIFVPSNFLFAPIEENDFFVNIELNFVFLLLKDRQVMFPLTFEGVFKLIVFVLHFVKTRHALHLRTAPVSSLTDALRNMDLKR